jgi:hypothetical protein
MSVHQTDRGSEGVKKNEVPSPMRNGVLDLRGYRERGPKHKVVLEGAQAGMTTAVGQDPRKGGKEDALRIRRGIGWHKDTITKGAWWTTVGGNKRRSNAR